MSWKWLLLSEKFVIFTVVFHSRLAISKWLAPRTFLMGGALGFLILIHTKKILAP
jgi:hypothetical protein